MAAWRLPWVRSGIRGFPISIALPTLIEVQLDSFEWFKSEGLAELFDEISPIESYNSGMKLFFPGAAREARSSG